MDELSDTFAGNEDGEAWVCSSIVTWCLAGNVTTDHLVKLFVYHHYSSPLPLSDVCTFPYRFHWQLNTINSTASMAMLRVYSTVQDPKPRRSTDWSGNVYLLMNKSHYTTKIIIIQQSFLSQYIDSFTLEYTELNIDMNMKRSPFLLLVNEFVLVKRPVIIPSCFCVFRNMI